MLRAATRRTRPGFTLVELMVAAAICVLIMAVLATAFQLGIDTMRQMKSTGELMDQLRGATTALQADLKANHLLNSDGQPVKLSSFRWDQVKVVDNGTAAPPPQFVLTGWTVPQNGFFRIGSGQITGQLVDADGLVNGTGIATNHYLHFTSILSGLSDDDYYAATTPTQGTNVKTFQSTAAELAYFLDPTPVGVTPPTPAVPGGTPLFRLVRRQRLVAVNDTDRRDRPWPPAPPFDHAVISLQQPKATPPPFPFLNTLSDLTDPSNRLGGTRWVSTTSKTGPAYAPMGTPLDDALAPMASRPGEDTLLSNVISFEVQVMYTAATDPRVPLATPRRTFTTGATDDPFDVLPLSPVPQNPPPVPMKQPTGNTIVGLQGTATYDSWSPVMNTWTGNVDQTSGVVLPGADVPPLLIRVQAVQVRIRIWDPKLNNARQVTVVQDL